MKNEPGFSAAYAAFLTIICLASTTANAFGQTYTEIPSPFEDFKRLGSCWGDYDSDGDLDLVISGDHEGFPDVTAIYKNDAGTFTDIGAGLILVNDGTAEWGDYDNDGDLDLAMAGYNTDLTYTTSLYRNDGNDTFTLVDPGLTGISGVVRWGDYDNDGDLDLFILGGTAFPAIEFTAIYRNEGNDTFVDAGIDFKQLRRGSADWGDYDNDHDLDLLLTGTAEGGFFDTRTLVYRNDGNDTFTQIDPGFFNLYDGQGRWGDLDEDGDLDILVTGSDSTSGMFYTFVYRNDGGDVFTDIHATIPGAGEGSSAVLGDCDNDGDLDALISSILTSTGFATAIFRNDGDSVFADLEIPIDVICCGSLGWADFDNDLDLDFSAFGYSHSRLFHCDSVPANTPPVHPTGLQAVASDSSVILSWQPASDNETQSAGLTYNIRIGTAPGGVDIISPMADPSTGYRRVVAFGNAYQNTSWEITGLAPGDYYWSVQTIDNAYTGSAFASEAIFSIPGGNYICGDADHSSGVDIDDVVFLISYIFGGGSAPSPLESGDADCSGSIDIDDAVYLIGYIFSSGPVPCDPNNDGTLDC